MEQIYDDVLGLIGRTPLVRLGRVACGGGAEVCGKLESRNITGSVKDRPALSMIRAAEKSGQLTPGGTVIEGTSGNTGVSLAMICAIRGYRCIIVMPEDMSVAQRHVLRLYGAEIVFSAAQHGLQGAVERAEELAQQTQGAIVCRQFSNPANPEIHAKTTAHEILEVTGGRVDALVAGVGTGGTLVGVGRVLKERNCNTRVVAVEPSECAVLSGGRPGRHALEGLGPGFIPEVLDMQVVDEVITVSDDAAQRMNVRLTREEGLLLGPSSGANVHAAVEVSLTMSPKQRVVTVLGDGGARHLF